ncbi:beta-1,6-N-acetylglucosaminyltransferase [Chroococcus sp. FPU101]|uniref:beta-1,6-N-acetylglucosaminyltransferase n=1 Tax=Chroococcus sp. FPU101 TaxID=1974212 RepID=UPI001A8FC91A|nr:beta-1,6-N-acetylglucosaminyltransferase [Chroococcus sp. FPU101]GFE69587.1 hypothetical protein MCAG_02742 [Chroococcus sp. FPU101]
MKICYFIQSHKTPEQIVRLVKNIQGNSNNYHIIISHDFSSSTLDVTAFNNLSNINIIRRNKPARRGDSSILNIYIQVIDYLLQNQINFDWLVTLSGQDYPIQPLYKLENLLKTTQYDGFLNYYDFTDSERPLEKRKDAIKRYTSQYISLPYWSKPLLNRLSKVERFIPLLKVQAYCNMIGIKSWSTPFNNNFIPYRGYYWNTLSKDCIIYFRNFLISHPKILKYYQKTLAPEESIIATVLVNSKIFNLSQNSIQYANFPLGLRGFAADVLFKDLANIVRQNYFFARKFDLDKNPQIFDFIDNELLLTSKK